MLALSASRGREDVGEMEDFPAGIGGADHFIDFGDGSLLDCIDFDDLFTEIEGDGEFVMPDLEMADHDIVEAEFSATSGGCEEYSEAAPLDCVAENGQLSTTDEDGDNEEEEGDKSASERDEPGKVGRTANKGGGKGGGKKSSSYANSKTNPPSQGKRKVKVDWTPDLHKRFVQAVEQLGLDKAVPSKILEIMGVEGLTRHNIASHLQKYRSHRKHLMAREAEAASWNHQRRHMYGGRGGKSMELTSPWLMNGPTMGFPPPMTQPPPPLQPPPFRPLHVWGHPSADSWPKHPPHPLPMSPLPPRPAWPPYSLPAPVAPPMDPNSYWNPHHHQVLKAATPGSPCFPQPRPFPGLMPGPPITGVPPGTMYKLEPGIGVPAGQSGPQPPPDFHPSRETVDAAIGDALTKPWQPLPLGLKPPSLDGVLMELHRQGIPDIPPSSPA